MGSFAAAACAVLACATLAGCETLALSAIGASASAGLSYTMNGAAYRTFTASQPKVRAAAFTALKRMASPIESTEKTDEGELIKAAMPERSIEVRIESLSPNATRVRAVAKRGMFLHDTATAAEIISQTERALSLR
ncbi:MAG TPA: DUF3568 family protein [Burkholderiales bacterium]|nr:DUF3568 family protein [Burkholderiales bacterium]